MNEDRPFVVPKPAIILSLINIPLTIGYMYYFTKCFFIDTGTPPDMDHLRAASLIVGIPGFGLGIYFILYNAIKGKRPASFWIVVSLLFETIPLWCFFLPICALVERRNRNGNV